MPLMAARKACSAPCWTAMRPGATSSWKKCWPRRPPAKLRDLFLHGVADFAADTGGKNSARLLASAKRHDLRRFQHSRRVGEASRRKGKGAVRALCPRPSEGDLPQSIEPAALASYIMAVSNGMCVQAASGACLEDLHAWRIWRWPPSPFLPRHPPWRSVLLVRNANRFKGAIPRLEATPAIH